MKVIVVLLGLILFDRMVPLAGWRFAPRALPIEFSEYMKNYGIFAFPRTLFEIGVLLATVIDYVIPLNDDLYGGIAFALLVCAAVSAVVDAIRAAKIFSR